NLCRSFKARMVRTKLVGKIFCNMAIEKIYSTYGRIFDKESCRRKQRTFKRLCEYVLHQCPITPKKCKEYMFEEV
ncbi:PIPO, partial [Wisteria vein mosaic virus]|uniref:PIPO n=1 Tax=Wisteria vein mosaic virus TaxID=201862 RepID=UPI0002656656